ncbi:MAG TPA: CPBP family intramembrane glutamic endopeptidase [Candidatus Dormibacteraeota bacterium]|nr:CPBP family intramembrane glutamic endopeptidase [Candidatus Dormibacteraeota bacterium]
MTGRPTGSSLPGVAIAAGGLLALAVVRARLQAGGVPAVPLSAGYGLAILALAGLAASRTTAVPRRRASGSQPIPAETAPTAAPGGRTPVTPGAVLRAPVGELWRTPTRVPDRRERDALLLGVLLGLALLLPGALLLLSGAIPRGAGLAAAFPGWAGAVLVVATAEEVLIRGVLQPRLATTAGAESAIVACALLFAAIHVPLYGVQALPLDLGAGLLIGWLRQRTGSVAACAAAHLVADLGGWFLP